MIKAIEITVLRVSSNGKYIEFIINCPADYYFTDFVINVYGSNNKYSLKDSLFIANCGDIDAVQPVAGGECYHNKLYYNGLFKLEDIDVIRPEMFEVELTAHYNPDSGIDPDPCMTYPTEIHTTAYISDVSNVYNCLMKDIVAMGEDLCGNSESLDRLIRNYLILYAHQEALKLRELADAKKYFTLLQNCFTSCGSGDTTCHVCNTCSQYPTYKPSNCGCGK